jgi:hypothetical protein
MIDASRRTLSRGAVRRRAAIALAALLVAAVALGAVPDLGEAFGRNRPTRAEASALSTVADGFRLAGERMASEVAMAMPDAAGAAAKESYYAAYRRATEAGAQIDELRAKVRDYVALAGGEGKLRGRSDGWQALLAELPAKADGLSEAALGFYELQGKRQAMIASSGAAKPDPKSVQKWDDMTKEMEGLSGRVAEIAREVEQISRGLAADDPAKAQNADANPVKGTKRYDRLPPHGAGVHE